MDETIKKMFYPKQNDRFNNDNGRDVTVLRIVSEFVNQRILFFKTVGGE